MHTIHWHCVHCHRFTPAHLYCVHCHRITHLYCVHCHRIPVESHRFALADAALGYGARAADEQQRSGAGRSHREGCDTRGCCEIPSPRRQCGRTGFVEALDKRSTTASAVEERVSRELGEHPQNPRALFGLWQALTRVGTRQRRVHGKVSMRPGRTGMSRCEQICIRANDAIIAHRQSLPATLCEMRPA